MELQVHITRFLKVESRKETHSLLSLRPDHQEVLVISTTTIQCLVTVHQVDMEATK